MYENKIPNIPPALTPTCKTIVVDDSHFVTKQLSYILSQSGYIVLGCAANGKEAIQLYKDYYPQVGLVTMDITMPVMNGIQALEQILLFDRLAKVVMISSLGMESLVKKALLLGAKGYIMKPLNEVYVRSRLARILNRAVSSVG